MLLLNPYLSSVSSQSPLSFVHKLTRRWRDLPVLAIRSCSLSAKLLTYLINLRDTLVIASGHITWGLPVLGEKSVVGCVAFARSFYFPKLFAHITAPVAARLAVIN